MDGSFLLILLGLGALLAFGDFFSSSNDDTTDRPDDDEEDDETPDDRTRAPLVMGTQGDDLIFSGGGEVVRGWSGDDTLITDGDSTLRGGSGDDTLMSIGGGALLRGGDGEDTFIIAPVDFTEDGELLNRSGATVEPTVIVDFNPDEDRLVLDLRGSAFVPADGEPVILTGVAAPDGEGMMVQVNGVNVVQLSSYGGEDMQAALEAIDIDVIGADFEFPETEEERIARTGIGNSDDNLIVAREGLDEYRGLRGDDTLVGFPGSGVSLFGNSGDDLIVAFGDDSAFGGSGDDTLIGDFLSASEGPQLLDGGYGHDLLVSHGGSVMTGGPGNDTFVISPAGIDDDGNFMAADGTPLPVSVITDFDVERDTLVLDLQSSYQSEVATWAMTATGEYDTSRPTPDFGDDVEISIVATDDGSMVLVNGIAFVELQGLTPEQVEADVTIEVTGAEMAATPI